MNLKNGRYRILLILSMFGLALALPADLPVSAGPTDDFVITVQTNKPGESDIDQFTIPTYSGETYKYSVDCNNDGHDEATAVTGDYTCDYLFKGTYTIRIKDDTGAGMGFPRIYFNRTGDKEKLISIVQWGTGKWTSMNSAFYGCTNLSGNPLDNPDLTNLTDLSLMFAEALSFNAPIGEWDTSNVTNMSGMFLEAHAFNQSIEFWDTKNVESMEFMFLNAKEFNQPIGHWQTGKVESMAMMFFGATAFNHPIGKWDTGEVLKMSGMFKAASAFNQPIGEWDTNKVTDMSGMFSHATEFDQDIGEWKVSSLTHASDFFEGVALSTSNYDFLLISWDSQDLYYGVNFGGGNSTYCQGESARAHMIDSDGWTITDGGYNCDGYYSIYLPLVIFNTE